MDTALAKILLTWAIFLALYFPIKKWLGWKIAERFNIACIVAMVGIFIYASLKAPTNLDILHFSGAVLVSFFATMATSVFFRWGRKA